MKFCFVFGRIVSKNFFCWILCSVGKKIVFVWENLLYVRCVLRLFCLCVVVNFVRV